jgi:hypothetical protein
MYSVKGFKEQRGTEGYAYNATLYRDGKKIAFVINEGNGGESHFDWMDRQAPKVDILRHIHRHGEQDEPFAYLGTPEEKSFVELADSQTYTFGDHTGRKNADILMEDLIEIFKMKRTCKTQTVFRLVSDGDASFQEIKEKFTPELRAWIVQKYGSNLVEIVNERPEIMEG